MGVYLKEYAPKIKGQGQREISLLIEQSFRKQSVYFEIYNDNDKWCVYWNFEIPFNVIRQLAVENSLISLKDIINNEEILENLHQLSGVFECSLNENDIPIVKQFLMGSLPEIERKPQGFDGHSYEIKIDKIDREYNCWCVIPKEWSCLEPLIKMLVEKAMLPDEYLVKGLG